MGSIELKRTFDRALIQSVLQELWGEIAESGVKQYDPDPNAHCYLASYCPEFMGLWIFEPVNSVTVEIHAALLKPYRNQSKASLLAVYNWFLGQTKYQKITASIPVFRKHVYRLAKQTGFLDEGINRKSYYHHQLYDQWLVGITRDEVKAYLCQ